MAKLPGREKGMKDRALVEEVGSNDSGGSKGLGSYKEVKRSSIDKDKYNEVSKNKFKAKKSYLDSLNKKLPGKKKK